MWTEMQKSSLSKCISISRKVTVEAPKVKENGIMVMSPQQEDFNKPKPKVRFRVF